MAETGPPKALPDVTDAPLIAVVGPCGAGKSTLVRELTRRGFHAREVAQEHSFVPAMWQRFTQPDLLIYLDVSREEAQRRMPQTFPPSWWEAVPPV